MYEYMIITSPDQYESCKTCVHLKINIFYLHFLCLYDFSNIFFIATAALKTVPTPPGLDCQ